MNREIKFRAYDDGKMLYSYNNIVNRSALQLQWFFDRIREDAIVMQFTGLKDKNGVDIYEGDILETVDRVVKVVWHEYAGQWDTDFIKYKGERQSNGLDNLEWKFRAEVIGNVFETPALLSPES